ncbi:heme peroxidase [Hyaloscypha bicolor E]|uniref:Peroxidase n=1 Tax=Hyaloscypha bicolor E TaxID=1095630 RepID=A0A2J6STQ3_9HELO|nr:heme peroxidase [Hyaloscypha bicolor E]PMD54073.1 heme peroxidase [Hyaloscypha bicolor E]
MWSFKRLLALPTILGLLSSAYGAFFYPNTQASLLEHILVDTHGAHSSGFADAITPCTNYVSGNQSMGRTTAAQWIRVAFHDFVTADVASGTGGLDASIGFETLREENSGSAFNDSFTFFRPYVNPVISTADILALSVVMSVGNCGGAQIPFRAGRIDATGGGAFGVPAPETDIPTTLGFFSGAGFNQVDSIGLTACGHTLGSVHHGGFPTVVGPEAVSSDNLAGGIHFDTTVANFDPLVVHEYLNGTGQRGGPLVTSFNVSSRSDLRLYESDNNLTMIALGEQGTGFLNTCVGLLQRMIETVPKSIVLSDVVTPMEVKPINASLDFDSKGNLFFSGYIRILTPTPSSPPSAPAFLTIASTTPIPLTPEPAQGQSIFGTTAFYPFATKVIDAGSFAHFSVTGHGSHITFPVQTSAFVVPSLTSVSSTSTTILNFTVATRSRVAPTVKVQVPVGQQGTLGPAIKTFDNVAVNNTGRKAGYELWAGSVDVGALATGALSVAILDGEGKEVDVGFF